MVFLALLLTTSPIDTSYTTTIAVAEAESLRVTVRGEGHAVVFIPGLFGSSYTYRHVVARLDGAGFQLIGVEPLGIGSSSRPKDADYSLTAQAERVIAVLDTLRVEQAVLVAHAVGASIAMRMAYRYPSRVRGIVSIEGGPGETATTRGFRRWMKFAGVAKLIDGRRAMARAISREMKDVSADDSWVTDRVLQAYTRGLVRDYRGTLSAYQGMSRSEEPELLRDYLHTIPCPVVLLVGETDHKSGPAPEEIALLAERLPAFSVDTVASSGFFIQEEKPTAVATAVTEIAAGPACGT